MNQSNLFNPKMKIYNLSFFILHFMAFIFSDSLINNYNLKISALILLISLFEIFLLIIFKFSTIFFITFLTSYLLLPLTIVSYNMTNSNLGIITLNLVPIHLEECIYDVYLFIFFFSFFCYLLNFQKKERMFINMNGIDLSNLSILFNNIVIYVFTIVAFPRLSLSVSDGEDRFKMLLPGHAWNQLVIAAIIFNLPYIRKRKSVMFSTAFAVIWYSLNGERADISGLILGIFIISMLSKNISKKIKFYSLILLFFSIIVYITIGNLRIHGGSVAVSKSFVEIATFSTVSDVAYIMNACIDYTHVIGHTGGKLLMELPSYAIPLTQHGSIGAYVDRFYADPGGTPLITPAILDFGKIGMFIYSFIYSILLGFITYFKESKLVKYEILLIACSIPRICWYGVNYVFPSFVFFIPILYLINIFINDFANNNNEKM